MYRLASKSLHQNLACRVSRRYASAELSVTDSLREIVLGPRTAPVPPVPTFPHSSLLPSVETKLTTLGNGIRVATQATGHDNATVSVWFDTGSRYETEENNGTAHFLEHMAFKGTAKRSQSELEAQVEGMGAHLNAYTSREHTVYMAKVLKNDVGTAVDILSDILQNAKLDPSAINRERDVILREMEEVDLQHSELVFDKLHQMAFRGSSLGRSIIGPEENVLRLNREHLASFIASHYTTDRMVVSAAGAVNHHEICKLVSDAFGNMPQAPPAGVTVTNGGKPYFIGSDVRMREDDMDEAHVAFAFESLPWSHPDALVLSVMATLLGAVQPGTNFNFADSAGKLARAVSEEKLASQVMPFNTPYVDTGLFGVYMVAPYHNLPELCWQAQEEVTRLCYEVDEDDVTRSVNQVKANLLYGLDGTQAVAEDIGRQVLTLGERPSERDIFARLDSIKAEDIKRVANSILYDRDPVVSALGPLKELPDYNKFRRRTYWLRY